MSAEKYADYLFLFEVLSGDFDEKAAGRWIPSSDMRDLFKDTMQEVFLKFGYEVDDRYDEIVESHFNALLEDGIVSVEGDQYTGEYFRFEVNKKDDYVRNRLKTNEVAKRIESLGHPALVRALAALQQQEGWRQIPSQERVEQPPNVEIQDQPQKDEIPASDRIVRFDDNSATRDEIIGQLENISEELRGHNDEDGKLTEVRERIQTELRAGRELLKSTTVRARALWAVLGTALTFIASEFAGGIIGELAVNLLTLLRPLLGL
jgi:hypothetical protein